MNNLQKLASLISGYDLKDNHFSDEQSALIIDSFESVVMSEYFHENVDISYRIKVALECVAFNDDLYEILGRAIALYQQDTDYGV